MSTIQNGGPSIGQMLDVAASGKSIDEMLEELGLVEHDRDHPNPEIPFGAFFFLTFAVFGQIKQGESLGNMDKLAQDLKKLVESTKDLTAFKDFLNNCTMPAQSSDQANAIALFNSFRTELNNARDLFDSDTWDRISKTADNVVDAMNNNWREIIAGRSGEKVDDRGNPITTAEMSAAAQFSDKVSQLQSNITGVSGTEASKMQFDQNNYNQMMSFYKEMLNYWSSMKKASNSAMAQAKS